MYAYITGEIVAIESDRVVVDHQGIGYEINASVQALSRWTLGDEVRVYTRYIVREDSVALFGFYDEAEREMFDLLTKVSAVGPKSALAILSALTVDAIVAAVQTSDVAALTRAPGVGKKTASRILLELTDALKGRSVAASGMEPLPLSGNSQALEALINLGYQQREAEEALKGVDTTQSTERVLREALARLGR
ncbi:MAG: Holliday junction branch migration protein RuvA [Peptoniphilaceae bacterium]|nr:Holliday junction branch migration protein RuvA [Peptoniphilaceae bacterium]